MSTISNTFRLPTEISEALRQLAVPPYSKAYLVTEALKAYKPLKKLLQSDAPIHASKSVIGIPATARVSTTVIAKGTVSPDSGLIVGIFDYWCEVMGRGTGTKLTPKRLKNIKARLKDGYKVEEIKRAIDGCKMSDFHMGGGHNDIELICREGEKVEMFIGKLKLPTGSATDRQWQAKIDARNLELGIGQDDFIDGEVIRD